MISRRTLVGSLALGMAAIGHVASLNAQKLKSTQAERAFLRQLNCADFSKNVDGSWTSHPNAMIDGNLFPNDTFRLYSASFDGVDIATALNRKCGKSSKDQYKADR